MLKRERTVTTTLVEDDNVKYQYDVIKHYLFGFCIKSSIVEINNTFEVAGKKTTGTGFQISNK